MYFFKVEKFVNYLTPLTLQVTLAVPHPHGAPRPPMVEAVAMTTMAAVPETAMAVVTVTRAVAASPIRLAVGSAAWAGPSGGPHPRSREATLLVTRTPAQAAAPPGVPAGAVGWIEEWPAADTEHEDNRDECHSVLFHCKVTCVVEQSSGRGRHS